MSHLLTFGSTTVASLLFGFSLAWAGSGALENQAYVQGFVGAHVGSEVEDAGIELDANTGIAAGGALGYAFAKPLGLPGAFRTEGEVSVRLSEVDVSGVDFNVLGFFGNGWIDLPLSDAVVPYVGGGVGLGRIGVDGEDQSGLAWQVGGGVNFNAPDFYDGPLGDAFFGINYRYVNVNTDDADGDNSDFRGHQIMGSIGIPFN